MSFSLVNGIDETIEVIRLNKNPAPFLVVFLIVAAGGLALRLPSLGQRPMHTDEAVHGVKFGYLLEENEYRYDPQDYHGPILNYLTLIPAWIVSAKNITEIDETTLRIVPVFFGMLVIGLSTLLCHGLGRRLVLFACLFTALSPAMVYYSRYYIQEMLLVSFTFGAIVSGYRYLKSKRLVWVISTGICLGLMHATKETSLIVLVAILTALFLTALTYRIRLGTAVDFRRIAGIRQVLLAMAVAFCVSAFFYSSFLTHPRGILDSFLTYEAFFTKAVHNDWHLHPWHFYLKLLLYNEQSNRPVWSEAAILVPSLIGFIAAVKPFQRSDADRNLITFIAFYTITSAVIYSALPYKTPWNMLGFHHGLIWMAAFGAVSILSLKSKKWLLPVFILCVAAGTIHLIAQSYLLNFKYEADPSNPYTYAHTSKDILTITEAVKDVARIHPDGREMFIEVICPGDDYWPLPWYLRSFPNVGWFDGVDFEIPTAPVILASPHVEADLIEKIYELPSPGEKNLYVPLVDFDTELRPGLEIRGYVAKDLQDKLTH